ncbi:hypothetical protein AWN76_007170 [Rhodothermaceae bacterium RA]|nr:hypothetical protein AWN76_007170 [Rhodothermaceae bacterium RA]
MAPIGDDYVRVFFHPYRQYVTGGRSKIPYLSRRLRRMLIPPLDEHFQAAGLRLVAPGWTTSDAGEREPTVASEV